MSLVTRCTSCGTLFKVVADQLKISDGWVRCGQCSTVFDAQAHLVEAPKSSRPAVLKPQPSASPGSSPVSSFDSIRDSLLDAQEKEAFLAAFATADAAPAPAALSSPTPPPVQVQAPMQPAVVNGNAASEKNESPEHAPSQLDSSSFRPGALRDRGELERDEGPSSSSWTASEYPDRISQIAADAQDSKPPELYTLPGELKAQLPMQAMPEFVQQAQRAARWRSPWVRLGLGMLALLLATGLALQVALHDKDHIASQWPQTKPWLEQLCQHAGCQVQALKRIEAIAVDASSFNRINKNNAQLEAITQSYRLGVTLKNTGTLPVALPHVELSLQDAQDQSILRRVLSPADLGSSLTALAPSQDMAGSLTLQVDTAQLANRRIQGYRVLAFYP